MLPFLGTSLNQFLLYSNQSGNTTVRRERLRNIGAWRLLLNSPIVILKWATVRIYRSITIFFVNPIGGTSTWTSAPHRRAGSGAFRSAVCLQALVAGSSTLHQVFCKTLVASLCATWFKNTCSVCSPICCGIHTCGGVCCCVESCSSICRCVHDVLDFAVGGYNI